MQTTGFQQQETCGLDTWEIYRPEKSLIGTGLKASYPAIRVGEEMEVGHIP
jgi:hypothetical protein